MLDLHTHSAASDGDDTPAILVAKAAKAGIRVLALTDHDTVSGVPEALEAARGCGVYLIPGVEIGMEHSPGEFHILGLALHNLEPMAAFCTSCLNARDTRNDAIFAAIDNEKLPVSRTMVLSWARGAILSRLHFAQALVEAKVTKNIETAFRDFLNRGKPLHVSRRTASLADACEAIHASGGKAVVAHPGSLYLGWKALPAFFDRCVEEGVDGIEAWHPSSRVSEAKRYEAMAQERGLCVTAGSDYHGPHRPDRKLGRSVGGKRPDLRFFYELDIRPCGNMSCWCTIKAEWLQA